MGSEASCRLEPDQAQCGDRLAKGNLQYRDRPWDHRHQSCRKANSSKSATEAARAAVIGAVQADGPNYPNQRSQLLEEKRRSCRVHGAQLLQVVRSWSGDVVR